jgi:hypothetical protein
MNAPSTQATAMNDLGNLAAEVAALGFQTTLQHPADDLPCLLVRNPRGRPQP